MADAIPASGSRLEVLRALKAKLARQIDACESGRDLAALTGRLQSVLAEIDELSPAAPKGDELDEIARRRASRQRGPSRAARPAKDAQ